MKYNQPPNKSSKDILRYASLGTQIFISLAIAVFLGYEIDKWIAIGIPLLVWLFPLLTLVVVMYKLIKETSKPNPDDKKK